MDIPSYFSILFILIGAFISLLSASISYLPQQYLNSEIKKSNAKALLLNKLRDRYEETFNGLFIDESVF